MNNWKLSRGAIYAIVLISLYYGIVTIIDQTWRLRKDPRVWALYKAYKIDQGFYSLTLIFAIPPSHLSISTRPISNPKGFFYVLACATRKEDNVCLKPRGVIPL